MTTLGTWPLNAGTIRRPVPIRCMEIGGLDTPPACFMSTTDILRMPGLWSALLNAMRRSRFVLWTDQPSRPQPHPDRRTADRRLYA